MPVAAPPPEVEAIADLDRAHALLTPLRLEILGRARAPRSATEIGLALGLPRQKVNYHVRELERARFLSKVGRRRRRGLFEQLYVATAASYVLAPSLLGPLQVDLRSIRDRFGVAYLQALAARTQGELSEIASDAAAAGQRVAVLALDTDLRFETAEQRERFAEALTAAVAGVVAAHSAPTERADGTAGEGRPYRLTLTCHPAPLGADFGGRHDPEPAPEPAPGSNDVSGPADESSESGT